uniref:CBFA2/RUNX1 partner transcriptional co-repressor 3 n=1 Tax=Myripristis murdjan TaxID=586833 RepID=A0A667WVE0_9TELE
MCGVSFKWHLQFYISVCALYTSHVGQARLYLQDTCALTMLFTPTGTMLNGSSHSPTSLNGAPSTPNGFSNGPAMSSTASLSNQQLPPACGARQLCKLKRFLTTLQQFGNDISPEIGERVRSLVLGLVNSTLTIEEFHSKLQEATNFPLRPFVIPFLKANLPLLQRELLHCARLAKQTPAQYLAQHEQLLLDANASSPLDSSEIMLEINEHGKRRTPDSVINELFLGISECQATRGGYKSSVREAEVWTALMPG